MSPIKHSATYSQTDKKRLLLNDFAGGEILLSPGHLNRMNIAPKTLRDVMKAGQRGTKATKPKHLNEMFDYMPADEDSFTFSEYIPFLAQV